MSTPFLAVRNSGYGGRGYSPIFEPEGAPVVPSVTTVLKALNAPALVQWSVDQTCAYYAANPEMALSRSEESAYNAGRWYHKREPQFDSDDYNPRDYHSGVLQDAADQGTWIHEFIEADLTGGFEPAPQNEAHDQMAEAYLLWKMDHDVELTAAETTVYGDGYAGTLDEFWKVDGVPMLTDTKSSRAIRDGHIIQLSALGAAHSMATEVYEPGDDVVEYKGKMFRAEPLPSFNTYSVLQVRPDDYNHKGEFIPAFCELHIIPTEVVETAFGVFQSALEVVRAEKKLKEVKKEMGWL